jgi:hypothetical protein
MNPFIVEAGDGRRVPHSVLERTAYQNGMQT